MWMSKRSATISARRATRRGLHPGCELLEGRALLATFQVADVAGLQAAVAAVNADPSKPATIELDPGTYDLTNALFFDHATKLTIEGNPSGTVVLDNPSHSDGILIFSSSEVTIEGLVITGGSSLEGGGIYADGGGGSVTIEQCTITGNTAFLEGGGIDSVNPLIVVQSTISGNTAQHDFGGGIDAEGSTLSVDQSTISGNSAGVNGGGIYNASAATISQSTISGNTALDGGGIYTGNTNGGHLSVSQSTISGNSASTGGGIFASGGAILTVDHCTISANTATTGGGLYAIAATVEIDNSTLNDPVGGGIFNDHSTIHLKNTVVDGVFYGDQDYP